MSTKSENAANPNSCWNKADPDEPLFILRSTDPAAPRLVRAWAGAYEERKTKATGRWPDEKSKAKYADAMAVAAQMEAYRK